MTLFMVDGKGDRLVAMYPQLMQEHSRVQTAEINEHRRHFENHAYSKFGDVRPVQLRRITILAINCKLQL